METNQPDDPWADYRDGPAEDDPKKKKPKRDSSGVGSFLARAAAQTDLDDEPEDDYEDNVKTSSPSRRPWKPPKVKHFRALEDVSKATEKMVKAYLSGDIDAEDVGAFAKLANTQISIAKAKATTAALGGEDPPDLAEQDERPDIEAVRPVMIEAASFETMTDEERRSLYEKIQSRGGARPTNGNGGNGDDE